MTSSHVHFGVNDSARAHLPLALHRLLQDHPRVTNSKDWGITGVGLSTSDQELYEELLTQDMMYTLKECDGDVMIIASLVDYVMANEKHECARLRKLLASSNTKLVSLSIDESSYNLANEDIQHDLEHFSQVVDGAVQSRSPWGNIVSGLITRKSAGVLPYTILSCDDSFRNGDKTLNVIQEFIREVNLPDLGEWIDKHGAFPNSIVKRNILTTSGEHVKELKGMGVEDSIPIVAEKRSTWILEDKFTLGRPEWEHVGAQFVHDISAVSI